ncbi:hypothetical protein QYS49_36700 [Marivirga salinae]|uniref:Uncharacterized protein n=1 Tax=Marivirga salinarum TaxID=3059078 RepID=A0AA51RE50_9BACT|nr:hypothetical protein [Marivirga sp. BDSF4-3]WMN10980.1 hypothetical protein QYS49_36700 [Marivirga sp. BDSF4-3]
MNDLIKNIGWENSVEVWHLAVLAVVFILAFVWEIRKQKPRKAWRTIALLFAFISLYIIYLSPYILTEKSKKSVLLIGQNISETKVDSLRITYDLEIFQRQSNSKFQNMETEQQIILAELNYQIDTAFVYGYLPQLNPDHYQVREDIKIEKGIQIDYPKSIALGDSLQINIQNLEHRTLNITAIIANNSISISIPGETHSPISILPKSSGYILSEIRTDNEDYHFAVKVEKPEHHVIQILAATPDFEWKFFSDYLKSKKHSVYQKTQISKGKFKSSFFNWQDTLQINRGVAKDLKVLFVDAKAWADLVPNEKNLYLEKLKENKGSLIFRTNPNSRIQLNLDKPKSTNIFSTSNNLLEQNNYNYLQFNNLYQLDEVAKNSVFRKVNPDLICGILNFQNSFQLKLSGKNREYEQIWSTVFSELIRKSSEIFYDKSKWSVHHQPFFFRLWSDEKVDSISIFNLQNDTIKLHSMSDFMYPERKHFMFYPQQKGWHFIKVKNQLDPILFFVHSDSLANQSEFLSNYNYDYLNYLNFTDSSIKQNGEKYNKESVTLWFFVLFLLCVGYLWIEDKIT